MKFDKILVPGTTGFLFSVAQGNVLAMYPIQKGEKYSYALLQSGKVISLTGARINGVGIPRYLAGLGYVPAEPGDANAEKLADNMDCRDGLALFESLATAYASKFQGIHALKPVTFIPFDPSGKIGSGKVAVPCLFSTHSIDFTTGLSSACVSMTEYHRDLGSSLSLSEGWVIAGDCNPADYPRVTEYGKLAENAMFAMQNIGIGKVVGNPHMERNRSKTDACFARGGLTMELPSGDLLKVGDNGLDIFQMEYVRGGNIIYTREDFYEIRRGFLANIIGAIMATLVHVQAVDAKPVKKPRKKAA